MAEHKHVQFVIIVSSFVDSCNFSYNYANLHTSKGKYLQVQSYFVKKVSSWLPGLECYWELSSKNQDLSHYVSLASHDYTEIFLRERMTRQVLGNWASPVDQVQMKGS